MKIKIFKQKQANEEVKKVVNDAKLLMHTIVLYKKLDIKHGEATYRNQRNQETGRLVTHVI